MVEFVSEFRVTLGSVLLLAILQAGAPTPRYETLDNGLRVVVVEECALPLVSVQLWYAAGSACDPPERPGMCSLARCILAQRDEAESRLRGAGLEYSSETYSDACSFETVLPPNFLGYVLDVEARRMRPVDVTSEALSRALGDAAAVSRRSTVGLESELRWRVQRAMFGAGPYGRPAGFAAASLAGVSTSEVGDFLETWFTPRNAVLFVIGDVSTPTVMDLVRSRFGEIPGGAAPQFSPRQAAPESGVKFVGASMERSTVVVAFQTPSLGVFENAAIDVLLQRLFDQSERGLTATLREVNGTAVESAWPRTYRWRDAGLLVFFVSFEDESKPTAGDSPDWRKVADQARGLIVRELSRAAEEIPSPVEHNRLRSLAARAERRRWMNFGSRARLRAEYEVVGGDLRLADFAVSRLRAVTVPDVQAAAALMLESPCVVMYPSIGGSDSEGTTEPEASLKLVTSRPVNGHNEPHLQRLARLVADAPQGITPERRPKVTEMALTPFVRIRTCQIAGADWATVATVLAPTPNRAAVSWDESFATNTDELRRFVSYAGYHAFDVARRVDSKSDRSFAGWRTCGEQVEVPAMLEWQAMLLREDHDKHAVGLPFVTIAAVGAVNADAVKEQTALNWANWAPATPDVDPDVQVGASDVTRDSNNGPKAPPIVVKWSVVEGGGELVEFCLEPDLSRDRAPDELEARELMLLCGATPGSREADAGDTSEFSITVNGARISARGPRDECDISDTVTGFAERLRRIRGGEITPDELSVAVRIARVQRLLELDSNNKVMSAILRGESDPWSLGDQADFEPLRQRLAELARATRLEVQIRSGEAPSAGDVEDLQLRAREILESGAP